MCEHLYQHGGYLCATLGNIAMVYFGYPEVSDNDAEELTYRFTIVYRSAATLSADESTATAFRHSNWYSYWDYGEFRQYIAKRTYRQYRTTTTQPKS